MKKILAIALLLSVIASVPALAHQPVVLTGADLTPTAGPLLVDGTVSFAVRASFMKTGEKKGFRAALKSGELLSVQYLIVDKKPDNKLKSNQLPKLTITSPSGKKINIKMTERTKFFEPNSGVTYLYLARYSSTAEAGIYEFLVQSRTKSAITIAVGDREVMGQVVRGALPTQVPTPETTPSPTPTPLATPTPSPTTEPAGYTAQKVAVNNSKDKCWSIIDGNVYDLTGWINSHPGGDDSIISLCGIDGTAPFLAKHAGRPNPKQRLSGFILGPLSK